MAKGPIYAHEEFRFAAPIANELAADPAFRDWLLSKTKFSGRPGTRVLIEEMKARRSPAAIWWRTNFRNCDCYGCSGGRETDIFAVLEDNSGVRFALHIEIKHPGDGFGSDQAQRYPLRAACWVADPSKTILPHEDATTIAIVDRSCLKRFEDQLRYFACVLTFDQLSELFPSTLPLARM